VSKLDKLISQKIIVGTPALRSISLAADLLIDTWRWFNEICVRPEFHDDMDSLTLSDHFAIVLAFCNHRAQILAFSGEHTQSIDVNIDSSMFKCIADVRASSINALFQKLKVVFTAMIQKCTGK